MLKRLLLLSMLIWFSACTKYYYKTAIKNKTSASQLIQSLKGSDVIWIIPTNYRGERKLEKQLAKNPDDNQLKNWLGNIRSEREQALEFIKKNASEHIDFMNVYFVADSLYNDFISGDPVIFDNSGKLKRTTDLNFQGFTITTLPQNTVVLRHNEEVVPIPMPSKIIEDRGNAPYWKDTFFTSLFGSSDKKIEVYNRKLHEYHKAVTQ